MEDPRFKHVATDPRFKAIPRRARKVRIDSRFQSMFTEKRFQVKYKVDRRGKKIKKSSSDDLKKYYELTGDSVEVVGSMDDETKERKESAVVDFNGAVGFSNNSDDGNGVDGDYSDSESSDSDGEESDSGESDSTDIDVDALMDAKNEITHEWGGEGERDIPRSEGTSSRLAVCGMDWDRISAHDLLVLFSSFRPQGGIVKSVAIYPSDFGQERMAAEDVQGPAELIEEREGEDEETVEGKGYAQEKLRQYQMNRLKYFYAIVDCDSSATASHIYDHCDGMEYEHSASKLDLRFVPDNINFNDCEPKSIVMETNMPSEYTPSLFFTSALQQSKVNLTWDETDPNRLNLTMRKFDKEDLLNLDYSAYVASSGDEDDELHWAYGEGEEEQIKKYRALLEEGDKPAQVHGGEELEITWNVGLQEVGKRILREREGLSLISRRDRQKRNKECNGERQEKDDLGFDDPFFLQSHAQPGRRKKTRKTHLSQEELQQRQLEKEELELLVMSDSEETGNKQHFSLKGLLAASQNKDRKGKKGRKRRKLEESPQASEKSDHFKVNHNDPRFSALYESHLYAVDPSDPHYKPTSGMKDIVVERQRRRAQQWETLPDGNKPMNPASVDPSLSVLVKSVKAKSAALRSKHK